MKKQSLVETLEGIHFLHDVSPQDLSMLADVATLRDVGPSQVIFREGDAAEHVYLVASGNLSIEICAPGIGCKRILTVGPGELLAWSALLDEARLTATARAIEATQLVELDATKLLALCQQHLAFGYELTRRVLFAMAKRLSATRMQLLNVYGSELPAAAGAAEDQHG